MRGKVVQRSHELKGIEGVPVEILLEIFKSLDTCSSLCLALSSPHIFPIYKSEHPIIPSLWTKVNPLTINSTNQYCPSWYDQHYIPLGDFLKKWIGPKYKPLTITWYSSFRFAESEMHKLPPYFILKSRYGSRRKQDSLIYRYHDYWPSERDGRHLLPHPKNKGPEWWAEARETMIREAPSFDGYNQWEMFWTLHLMGTMSRLTKLKVRDDFIDRELLRNFPTVEKRRALEKTAMRYKIYLRLKQIPSDQFAADLSNREAWYKPRPKWEYTSAVMGV